jgi:NAD(P) transhydrogenase subunit beta
MNRPQMPEGQQSADNELFYLDKTMMVFGDAKKVVEDMVKAVEQASRRSQFKRGR